MAVEAKHDTQEGAWVLFASQSGNAGSRQYGSPTRAWVVWPLVSVHAQVAWVTRSACVRVGSVGGGWVAAACELAGGLLSLVLRSVVMCEG
jgi:hypothetical protein